MEVATDRYTRIRFGLGTVKGESSLYLWNLLDTYKKNVYFMLQNERYVVLRNVKIFQYFL